MRHCLTAPSCFGSDGWGAFEIALRLSRLDLTDGGVSGSRERNASVAFNWCLNQYLRISANVIKVLEVDGGTFAGKEPTVLQAWLQLVY